MELIEINKDKRLATFLNLKTKEKINKNFDAMHFTPHMKPNKFLSDAGITNELGYVLVD